MPRHAVFLRGVSPQNLKMPDLARVLEGCGYANVRTLLSSGNATFDARAQSTASVEKAIERALADQAGKRFAAFVRTQAQLDGVLAQAAFPHPAGTKRVVVFFRQADASEGLPVQRATWALLHAGGTESHGYYTPGRDSSAFMAWLARRYGAEFTTRTVETVRKCAAG